MTGCLAHFPIGMGSLVCIHHQKTFHAMNTLYRINCQNVIARFTFLGCQCHFALSYNDNSPYQKENEPGNQPSLEIYFPSFSIVVEKKTFYFLCPINGSENIFLFSLLAKTGGKIKSSLPQKRWEK